MRRDNLAFTNVSITNYFLEHISYSLWQLNFVVNAKLINNLLIGNWKLINCVSIGWGQAVDAWRTTSGQNSQLCATAFAALTGHVHRILSYTSFIPQFGHQVVHRKIRQTTEVMLTVLPTIHRTNKDHDKLNILKNTY